MLGASIMQTSLRNKQPKDVPTSIKEVLPHKLLKTAALHAGYLYTLCRQQQRKLSFTMLVTCDVQAVDSSPVMSARKRVEPKYACTFASRRL